jgi:hypothetical protein
MKGTATGPQRARSARRGRATVKEAIQQAAEAARNMHTADDNESVSRTLVGYLQWLAMKYPSEFLRLLDRVLQLEVKNADPDTELAARYLEWLAAKSPSEYARLTASCRLK